MNEFFNPENVGVIKGAHGVGKVVGEGAEIMKIYVSVENDTITEATYQTFGCVGAIACCSMATKMLIGKTIEDAERLVSAKTISNELGGLDARTKKYAQMAEKTVKATLINVQKKA